MFGDLSQPSRRPFLRVLTLREMFSDETPPQRTREAETSDHSRVAAAATTTATSSPGFDDSDNNIDGGNDSATGNVWRVLVRVEV